MARRELKPDGRPLTLGELLSLPLADTDKMFLAFGKAMAAWARIEIGFYIWFEHMAGFDYRQAKPIYYSATNFKSRLDLVRAAMDGVKLEPDEGAFIKTAMDVAVRYNSFRNKLAHGEFTFDGLLIESKHADSRRARAEAISAKELLAFADMADEFAKLLYRARDLALGFDDEDEPHLTLNQCAKRVRSLPRPPKAPAG